eukprot:COSAG06_NODE_895_length_11669_cov_5.131384_17_plen_202_part_00
MIAAAGGARRPWPRQRTGAWSMWTSLGSQDGAPRQDKTRQDKTRQHNGFCFDFARVCLSRACLGQDSIIVFQMKTQTDPLILFPFPFSLPSSVYRFAGRRCSTRWRWCSSSAAASSRACAPSSSRAAAFGTDLSCLVFSCLVCLGTYLGSQEETKDSSVQSVFVFFCFALPRRGLPTLCSFQDTYKQDKYDKYIIDLLRHT